MDSAATYCVGCGENFTGSSKNRRDFGANSKGKPETCQRVRVLWTFLMQQELGDVPIDSVFLDLDNPGRMCKGCFNAYDRYSRLLVDRMRAVGQRITTIRVQTPTASDTVSCSGATADTPTRRKRGASSRPREDEPQARRPCLLQNPPLVLSSCTASPPVIVCIT